MPNSPEISKLQPGATYHIQVIPRGQDISDDVASFAKTITIPKTNPDGSQLIAINSALRTSVEPLLDANGDPILDADGNATGGQIVIANSVVPQVQVGTATLLASPSHPVKILPGKFARISNVIFEKPFTTIPHITLTLAGSPGGSSPLAPRIYNWGKNKFDILIFNTHEKTSITLTKNLPVSYIAAVNVTNVGPSASSSGDGVSSLTAQFDPASSSSNYIINLDWPDVTGSVSYVLQQSQNNFSITPDWTITTHSPSSFYVTNVSSSSLDPKEYFYRVDTTGTGTWDATTSIATGAPFSAENVILTTVDSTTVNVFWDQKITDGSPITYYDVSYGTASPLAHTQTFSGIEYDPRVVSGQNYVSASVNISGINASGTYTFSIDTENKFGKSSNTSYPNPTSTISVAGIPGGVISGSTTDIIIKDEGTVVSTAATMINFTGPAVTATASGASVTVNITGTGGSGGALIDRQTASITTSALTNGSTESGSVTMAPAYRVLSVTVDKPSRVRLYTTDAARVADMGRIPGVDPTGDHGVMLDVVMTTSGSLTMSPLVDGFVPSGSAVPYAVTNNSGSTANVHVGFQFIQGDTIAASGGGGSSIAIQDESSTITSAVTDIAFVGSGVNATAIGDTVTVTIPGATSASPSINLVSGDHTLLTSDAWNVVQMDNSSAASVTVPANSSVVFGVGTQIDIMRTGSGSVTIIPDTGVTINYYSPSSASSCIIAGRFAAATAIQKAVDDWVIIGSLA